MKKTILDLGKSLNKTEQKKIKGGNYPDHGSCMIACRSIYGFYGVCCPESGEHVCYDGMASGPKGC